MRRLLVPFLAVLAAAAPAAAADLSVLSYNIHGLPWPIVHDRTRDLQAIGDRLAAMRAAGTQPHLVLLQEAFTGHAKAIGSIAGYPYAVRGPDSRGDLEDSGLLILSDYPVLGSERIVYRRGACAGLDCLSNKGALLVRVAVPGLAQPLAVVDTHMNARARSCAGRRHSDRAYAAQVEELRQFVASRILPGTPAIVGGDMNVGRAAARTALVTGDQLLAGSDDAVRTALAGAAPVDDPAAAAVIARRNKDWLFARGDQAVTFRLASLSVPFPRGTLSDHGGYIARYALVPSQAPAAVRVAGLEARP
ncbi:endonuclease [Sphingomonas ginkgonis]|uniref:Endonuclease n=1 Tax=Sphingomonas ginkgonis TaxID=2315330 RepID=A0A429VC42_9SPHN|nr:endonuclease/exonuclease/phosphatase family protein [Sphingomonas ginkgonis]RST31402.1 endonuclease [Sphingomonas ginkgonis]